MAQILPWWRFSRARRLLLLQQMGRARGRTGHSRLPRRDAIRVSALRGNCHSVPKRPIPHTSPPFVPSPYYGVIYRPHGHPCKEVDGTARWATIYSVTRPALFIPPTKMTTHCHLSASALPPPIAKAPASGHP